MQKHPEHAENINAWINESELYSDTLGFEIQTRMK